MRRTIQRLTKQRQIILEELQKTKSHPTADELYQVVRKRIPNISLGTVYRNLEILASCGLIKKLEIAGSQKRFDANMEDHQHVRCICCGRVDDLYCDSVNPLDCIAGTCCDYEILDYKLEFLGLCPECIAKKKQQKRSTEGKAVACESKSCGTLTEEQKKILEALAGAKEPIAIRDISAATGIPCKSVSCRIRSLKNKGYIESPARCKYTITGAGKSVLAE